MLKKLLNKIKEKVLLMTMCMTIMLLNPVFATSSDQAASVATGLFDAVWGVLCAIPAIIAVLSGVNAGIAYAEAHSDGGNAAASGKFSSQLRACLISIIVTILCATKLKELVGGFFK